MENCAEKGAVTLPQNPVAWISQVHAF